MEARLPAELGDTVYASKRARLIGLAIRLKHRQGELPARRWGADAHARFVSVVQTAQKQGRDAFAALEGILPPHGDIAIPRVSPVRVGE